MKQCMDADNLHRRLKKIIGQVQAIDKMIDEDVPCEDVLAQINAAKSALHKAGQAVDDNRLLLFLCSKIWEDYLKKYSAEQIDNPYPYGYNITHTPMGI